jgi:DNA-binding PadR family transcriptional regulator
VPIPEITSLQFLVLTILLEGEQSGRFVREKLADNGHKKSAPAFYQFMARLEDGGFVMGRYEQKNVEGQLIKERIYTITGHGIRSCEEFRNFVLATIRSRPGIIGA